MSSNPRSQSDFEIYHIVVKGINDQFIFEDNEDKNCFMDILSRYKNKYGFYIHAYCLMDNHVHLLLKMDYRGLSNAIRDICSRYVTYFNDRHQRSGPLFQGRFQSFPVDEADYYMTVLRYILYNPVKAGMAVVPEDYTFSSAGEYFCDNPGLTDVDNVKAQFPDTERFLMENKTPGPEYFTYPTDSSYVKAKNLLKTKYNITDSAGIQALPIERQSIVLKDLQALKVPVKTMRIVTGLNYTRIHYALKRK